MWFDVTGWFAYLQSGADSHINRESILSQPKVYVTLLISNDSIKINPVIAFTAAGCNPMLSPCESTSILRSYTFLMQYLTYPAALGLQL